MQEILVRREGAVMMSILIVFSLLLIVIVGFSYAWFVHQTIKKEFEEKNWMDNSEYDYGHNVRHTDDDSNF